MTDARLKVDLGGGVVGLDAQADAANDAEAGEAVASLFTIDQGIRNRLDTIADNQGASASDPSNETSTPLAGDAVWRGVWLEWTDDGYVALNTLISSDVAGTFYVDISTDTSVMDGDDTSISYSMTAPYNPARIANEPRTTPQQGKWVRLRYVNGPDAQTELSITNEFLNTAASQVFQPLASRPKDTNLAGLSRAVATARGADGSWSDVPLGGRDPDNSTFIASLAVSDTWEGEVVDLAGINSLTLLVVSTTELDTALWRWYTKTDPDDATEDPAASTDPYLPTSSLDYTTVTGVHVYLAKITTMTERYGRFEIANGTDEAATVGVYTWNAAVDTGTYASPVSAFSVFTQTLQTVTALQAVDEDDTFLPIGRDGAVGTSSLNTYDTRIPLNDGDAAVIVEQSGTVTPTPADAFSTGQLAVGTSRIQVPNASGFSPAALRITHPGKGETPPNVLWGGSGVTALNGDFILPGSALEIPLDSSSQNVYLIAEPDATPVVNDETLESSTVGSSTGVASPTDVLAENGTEVEFDAVNDEIILDGFSSGDVPTGTITDVVIKAKLRREVGSSTKTAAHVASDALDASGSTTITTSTVPLNADAVTLVAFARRATDADITSVSNTCGFTGQTLLGNVDNGNESFLSVYQMTGTQTSAGTISASTDANTDHEVAAYIQLSDVAAVEATDTDSSAGATSLSLSAAGTDQGMAVVFAAGEIAQPTVPTGYTREAGAFDGSTTNNDQLLAVAYKPLTATGAEAVTQGYDTNGDAAAMLVTLTPTPAADPEFALSYEISGTPGDTSSTTTISNDTLDFIELDVSIDREWVAADFDDLDVSGLLASIDVPALFLDWIAVDVSTAVTVARVSYAWLGDS